MTAKYSDQANVAELDLSYINQPLHPDGDFLIHLVTRLGTLEEIDLLLTFGADINAIGDVGFTPLHCAVFTGRLDMVEKLLALGADPTIRDELDETPAALARAMERIEIANLFIQIDTPLEALIAKYRYHTDFAELDLSDINKQSYPDDDSLLHLVTQVGTIEEIELLTTSGARVNATGDMGYTPLHYAALAGRLDVAQRLLTLGADPTIRNEFDDTPASVARAMGYTEIFNLLSEVNSSSSNASVE